MLAAIQPPAMRGTVPVFPEIANTNQSSPDDLAQQGGYTGLAHLQETVEAAKAFLPQFHAVARVNAQAGLYIPFKPSWADKLIREHKGVPQAILAKIGSQAFAKRRPADMAPFLNYVQTRYETGQPLHIRTVVGPVKNVQRSGAAQSPDLAEYLSFVQLARLMAAIAPLYPHGIKVQMVPDDQRASIANHFPASYSRRYIAGLQALAQRLSFDSWLHVENGQSALYQHYGVRGYYNAAQEELLSWQARDPAAFATRWEKACAKARENLVNDNGVPQRDDESVHASAWRYLIAHRAEVLSGMWSPQDALPLIYANHPGNFQIYTMGPGGPKGTKLPWQIVLPESLLSQYPQEGPMTHRGMPDCNHHELRIAVAMQ